MPPAGDFPEKINQRGHRAFLRELRVLCGESLPCLRLLGAVLLVCVCLAGCGGGGGTTPPPPPPPTCPSGAVTLNPTSIFVGAASQASAPAGFTGGTFSSDNTNVAAISGSTVTGVADGTANINGAGWINANGATGCALSGAAITVTTPPSPTITSVTKSVFRCDAECGVVPLTMLGSGFESGDTTKVSPLDWTNDLVDQFQNSGKVSLGLGFDSPHTSPGPFTFERCRATGACSNIWSVALVGNQNDLVIGSSGMLYNQDRVAGRVWEFQGDGTPLNNGGIEGVYYGEVGIAYDRADNLIWENDGAAGSAAFNATNGQPVTAATDGYDLSDSSSEGGFYCGTEAVPGNIACLNVATINPTFAYAPAGTEPWSITMLQLGQNTQSPETDAFVYDRQGTALYDYVITPPSGSATIPTITLKPLPTNPLVLTGLTAADTLNGTGNGGWYLGRFETGPAAGTVALLSAFDNVVMFVKADTMTLIESVSLNLPAGSGVPFRMAVDETNGRAVVALANVGSSTSTTFVAVTPAGAVTPLTAVANNVIAVGLGVSADGSKLYACQRNQCQALPNQ